MVMKKIKNIDTGTGYDQVKATGVSLIKSNNNIDDNIILILDKSTPNGLAEDPDIGDRATFLNLISPGQSPLPLVAIKDEESNTLVV